MHDEVSFRLLALPSPSVSRASAGRRLAVKGGGRCRPAFHAASLGQSNERRKSWGSTCACTLRESPAAPVDFEVEEATALHYWRKHPNLHGWMERLYREEGGTQISIASIIS
ncbi:hypothetical protein A8M32_08600 [Sinorhizobium alkalisoli]|uniref:Uncharacterized protein n=1 Tax=Sinorhizobium alkalisoli TaxID=1752398 RepID=A0A1E3VEA0_9HYPH|nr:hypothetical protein A8M32_08600 [Sinorhizobium alkalisoli]